MRVYLDDVRPCPEGWVPAKTYQEAIYLLKTGWVAEISFDHDLGEVVYQAEDAPLVREMTGYDVVCWIEEAVFDKRIPCPEMHCHSANPEGRRKILQAIEAIKRRNKL